MNRNWSLVSAAKIFFTTSLETACQAALVCACCTILNGLCNLYYCVQIPYCIILHGEKALTLFQAQKQMTSCPFRRKFG